MVKSESMLSFVESVSSDVMQDNDELFDDETQQNGTSTAPPGTKRRQLRSVP
jgi:hypothetical protein